VLPRGVRRALDAMRAAGGREIGIAELAIAAGTSSRTLQRQFKVFFGKAPGVALRDIRFEFARRELLQGSPGTKVMDVAMRWGFPHCGRFSIEYRRRYRETPSQTLKRQAVFASVLTSRPQILPFGAERPSIAVVPIESSPENGEAARSIAEEMSTALARAGVIVASQGKSARYRLAGTLKEVGNETRLTLRLVEGETGRHLWAHRSEGLPGRAATFEDHLATKITAALQPCLRSAEVDRAQRKPDSELSAHDLALRAMPHVLSLDASGNTQALDLLDRALDRDDDHPLATALAAWVRVQRVVYHFSSSPLQERSRAAELVRRAQAQCADATVLAVLGNALTFLNDLDGAEHAIGKALSIDGGSAWAWARSGWLDLYRGRADSAIERFTIAHELAPHDPLAFNNLVGVGCAHFHAGRYLDATKWQERALLARPSAGWIHRTMCPGYVLAGARPEAARSIAGLRKHYPHLTLTEVSEGLPPLPRTYCDRVVAGLQGAGLPR
jgi:AraC-like DNA-binding protein/TolB-like protein